MDYNKMMRKIKFGIPIESIIKPANNVLKKVSLER